MAAKAKADDAGAQPASERGKGVGDFTVTAWTGGAVRPVIITSVNPDGSVNGRVIDEPGDNPKNDGNYVAFARNLKV